MKPETVVLGERALGREVVSWERIVSRGYSVAEHWRLELADGSTAFAKGGVAVDRIAESLRTEHALYARLEAPFLPRLLGWVDGELPVLVLET